MRDALRCPSRIHGVVADGRIEVKCRSSRCGAGKGVTVLHYFNLLDGELIETRKFKEPKGLFYQSDQKVRM